MRKENSMIRIGIYGYGNLAKGVELAVNAASDMELVAKIGQWKENRKSKKH